jgi:hypothetical protein
MAEDKIPREDEFMEKLIALSKEYGIAIGACGCCGSPWLIETKDIRRYDNTVPDSIDLGLGIDQLDPLKPFTME